MRTGHVVNQGGTAGGISRIYIFFSNAELVLDRNYFSFCQGLFLFISTRGPKQASPLCLRHFCLNNFMVKIDKKITKC